MQPKILSVLTVLAICLLAANAFGECVEGSCTNGLGTYISPDGSVYVGDFMDESFNGQGTYTFASGAIYVGGFEDNKFHGQGTYTTPDGLKYAGEFMEGEPHGSGVESLRGEVRNIGYWRHGIYVGQERPAELE